MDSSPYTIEQITPKEVKLTSNPTIIWNLHASEDYSPYKTPGGYSNVGTIVTVDCISRHSSGDEFYLSSNRSQGYDTLDCQDVVQVVEAEPEPIVEAPSGIPGGIRVPLNRVKFTMVVKVPGYAFMSFALEGKNSVAMLDQGTWYMTYQSKGMAKIDRGEHTKSYWINPADNVPAPAYVERKDTRTNYSWYSSPIKYKADQGYMSNHAMGEVFSFVKDKDNAKIKRNQPVYIAGTFTDGEQLFGVPANLQTDGEFSRVLNFGILMSYLSLDQMDYVPEDELIQDVQPAEAVAMVPRQVTLKDKMTLAKAHVIKSIDGLRR